MKTLLCLMTGAFTAALLWVFLSSTPEVPVWYAPASARCQFVGICGDDDDGWNIQCFLAFVRQFDTGKHWDVRTEVGWPDRVTVYGPDGLVLARVTHKKNDPAPASQAVHQAWARFLTRRVRP
jgi:hypothetical protein